MPSLLHFQIVMDVAFFVVIMLLLRQLDRRMARNRPEDDGATVEELKKLMTDSQDSTDLFLRAVRESEERLNKLARQLDNREKKIVVLIENAESLIQQMAFPDGEKYGQIMGMVQEGLGREEVAKRLGVAMCDIDLAVDLEKVRNSQWIGDR